MTPLSIHPHKAYLNTEVCMKNNTGCPIIVYDRTNDCPIPIREHDTCKMKLSAGKHVFKCIADGEEITEEVSVEDAIKIGGSNIKKAFVSEKSPWILIVMKDRTYFYNRKSKEHFLEYEFTPDEVSYISEESLLISSSQESYSVFSLTQMKPIIHWKNKPLFIDSDHCVTVEEPTTEGKRFKLIRIFNTRTGDVLQTYNGLEYMLNYTDKLLYVYDGQFVESFSLCSCKINKHEVKFDFCVFFPPSYYATIDKGDYNNQGLIVWSIESGDEVFRLKVNGKIIAAVNNKTLFNPTDLKSDFNSLIKDCAFPLKACVSAIYYKFEIYSADNKFYYLEDYNFLSYESRYKHMLICKKAIYDESHQKIIEIKNEPYFISHHKRYLIIEQARTVTTIKDGEINVYENSELLKTNREYMPYLIKETVENGWMVKDIDGCMIGKSDNNINTSFDITDSLESLCAIIFKQDNMYDIEFVIGDGICFRLCFDISYKLNISHNNLIASSSDGSAPALISCFNGTKPLIINDIRKLLAISEDGNICICSTICGPEIHIWNPQKNIFEIDNTITSFFDTNQCLEASFSVDGEHVVYVNMNNEHVLYNINTEDSTVFQLDIPVKREFNGYRSLTSLEHPLRRAIVVDPVTLQDINPNYLSQYRFFSPSGKYFVDSSYANGPDRIGLVKYYDFVKKNYLDQAYYKQLDQTLNVVSFAGPETFKARIEFCLKQPEYLSFINKNIIRYHERNSSSMFYARFRNIEPSMEKLNSFIHDEPKLSRDDSVFYRNYFTCTQIFTDAFLRQEEYIVVHDTKNNSKIEIGIGTPLWFLNYISFNCTENHIAIAGRYPDNTIDYDGNNKGGLLLVYDLIKKETLINRFNTNAVWTCAFNKDGQVAYYDCTRGSARTYYQDICDEQKDPIEINSRNFMCFSPKGRYMALSNKGYALYKNANPDWGHKPSTEIFIHSTTNPTVEIARFNDHGDEIRGTGSKNVCMVSFSSDEKKLLSVSNDNVMVIRNLHLD